jgi:hypothetical protein
MSTEQDNFAGSKVRPWTVRDAEEVSDRAEEWSKGWSDRQ